MRLKIALSALILSLPFTSAFSQDTMRANAASAQIETQDPTRHHSIGSTLFVLGNLAPGDPPHFFQLNYGYQLTRNEVLLAEAITWTYYEPLGSYGSSAESYPGKVSAYGLGVGYQRFYWKNPCGDAVSSFRRDDEASIPPFNKFERGDSPQCREPAGQ